MHSLDTLEVAKQEGRAPWTDVQLETKEFVVYNDGFPVTPGHTLVVPRESNMQNLLRCFNYAMQMGNANVEGEGNEITGFNVGINVGKSAGNCDVSCPFIFRRDGEDPRRRSNNPGAVTMATKKEKEELIDAINVPTDTIHHDWWLWWRNKYARIPSIYVLGHKEDSELESYIILLKTM